MQERRIKGCTLLCHFTKMNLNENLTSQGGITDKWARLCTVLYLPMTFKFVLKDFKSFVQSNIALMTSTVLLQVMKSWFNIQEDTALLS